MRTNNKARIPGFEMHAVEAYPDFGCLANHAVPDFFKRFGLLSRSAKARGQKELSHDIRCIELAAMED